MGEIKEYLKLPVKIDTVCRDGPSWICVSIVEN